MKKLSTLVAMAVVAFVVFLGAPNGALAQTNTPDFERVRAAVAACANLPGPTSGTATCAQWAAVANCIAQTAANSVTCGADMAAGAQAVAAMQTVCDASHVAEVTSLRAQLASCGSPRPAAPTTSRRLTAPRCLAQTGAALVCRDRRGNWHRESAETHACTAHVGNMVQFACACPMGSPGAARIAYRNGRRAANTYACMTGAATAPVVTERTEIQVREAEAADLRGLAAIRSRVDHACETFVSISRDAQGALVFSRAPGAPVMPAASDIGPTTPGANHNCADASFLLDQLAQRFLIAGSSPTVVPANLTEVNRQLGVHTVQIAELQAGRVQDRAAHQVLAGRVGALERRRSSNWQVSLFTGALVGWTALSDLGGVSAFSHTGVQGRYWFNSVFGIQASAGFLAGHIGAPYIDSAVGYTAQAGVAFHFQTGSVSHMPELGFEVRTYTLTGFQQISTLDQVRMIGDYEGRSFNARAAWTFSFGHGVFGVTPSFSLGHGDNVYGVAHRGTLNFVSGEGVEAVAGISLSLGLGEPPPAVASDPEPVVAAAPVSASAPVAAPPVTPVVTAPAPQPTPPPAAAATAITTPVEDEVPFLEGVGS